MTPNDPDPPRQLRRTDCPPDMLSEYETALKQLRSGSRLLRHRAESRDATREVLVTDLADTFRRSCDDLSSHFARCYDLQADLFVQLVVPPKSPSDLPDGYRVLSSPQLLTTDVMGWDTSRHLYRLFYIQGDDSRGEKDWASVHPQHADVRGESVYHGGISVVIRHGLLPQAANGRRASDVIGFISALTPDRISAQSEPQLVHAMRCYGYAATIALETYELATWLVDTRRSLRKLTRNLLSYFRFPGTQ